MTPQPQQQMVVYRTWSRWLGLTLLGIWAIIVGAIGIGIPLGALSPLLNYLLFIAGILIVVGR